MNHLSEKIESLKHIFDTSLEGVVISDMRKKDQPIIYCNQMFTSMTGYKHEEVIGKNCRFMQGDERNQPGLYVLRAALSANQPCKVVLRNFRKNGQLFYNRLSIFPVADNSGEVTHYVGIQDDITDMVETKDKLLKIFEERQVLLSEVHHRVKNNLAVIAAMLDMESYNEENENAIQKSRLRIKSMALIHENIYKEDGLAKIRYDQQLKKLIKTVEELQSVAKPAVNFNFELKKTTLNINQAIPLTIAASEIIDNIFKHAFEPGETGSASVHLLNNKNRVTLHIANHGKALPENFSLDNDSGTGLTICTQALSQIDADFRIGQKPDEVSANIEFISTDLPGSSQSQKI